MARAANHQDPNSRPRRALSAEERSVLFREFKLGLLALAVLVVLVVTLCWDRSQAGAGGGSDQRSARPRAAGTEGSTAPLHVVWRPIDIHAGSSLEPGRGGRAPAAPAPQEVRGAPPESFPAPAPQRAPEQPPRPVPNRDFRRYVVRAGDNPWRIAARELGNGALWPLIAEANPGLEPRRLQRGQVLRMPPKPSPASAFAQAGSGRDSRTRLLNAPGGGSED